jgi:hypothetical protein
MPVHGYSCQDQDEEQEQGALQPLRALRLLGVQSLAHAQPHRPQQLRQPHLRVKGQLQRLQQVQVQVLRGHHHHLLLLGLYEEQEEEEQQHPLAALCMHVQQMLPRYWHKSHRLLQQMELVLGQQLLQIAIQHHPTHVQGLRWGYDYLAGALKNTHTHQVLYYSDSSPTLPPHQKIPTALR